MPPAPENPDAGQPFLVAGATCRPVARSMIEAGFACRAIDLFADWDTQAICAVEQAASMAAIEQRAIETLGGNRLVLASGGENFAFIQGDKPDQAMNDSLLGSNIAAIRRARDPFFLQQILNDAGIPTLKVQRNRPPNDQWIWKPFQSGGGTGVRRLSTPATSSDTRPPLSQNGYFQQFQTGPVIGAAFLADNESCEVFALSNQLVGRIGQNEFTWVGASLLSSFPQEPQQQIAKIGRAVAKRTGLIGWFGIDFILDCDQQPLMIEVNPRYTSTMEIWERQTGRSLFALHHKACHGTPLSNLTLPGKTKPGAGIIVKSYLYNRNSSKLPLHVTKEVFEKLVAATDCSNENFITDVPNIGTQIGVGDPVCTTWIARDNSSEGAVSDTPVDANERYQRQILSWFE